MASVKTTTPSGPASGLDRQSPAQAQDELAWDMRGAGHGRLRMRTLVTLRWTIILGEVAVLLIGGLFLGFKAPYAICFGLIGAAAWINLLTGVASPGQRMIADWEATAQLGFDVAQISVLLFLTGGTANPFILMLIAPVTLAAATLPLKPFLILGGAAVGASLALAFFHLPLPMRGPSVSFSLIYMLSCSAANVAGILVIASSVRQAAQESARMALALDVTQTVLSREQRLSALGALAAAAAHELGTPLATIAIVAKEMAREAPTPQVKEDADLLIAQAARCREILRRLTDAPAEASDEVHERMSLLQLVHEVIEPHAGVKGVRVEAIVSGAAGAQSPDIWRMPEVLHALTSFVENAVDFATSEVLITARFDAQNVSMEVRDDGPGFAPEVLAKLGEPYVTTRPGAEGSRTGHIGMGLGFFIAKTLLERTGAAVTFQNGRPRGAVVSARWSRAKIEAPLA
ncbi:ActS/PrrB/RegB family redox-sensitive histidine kinase [Phenylobacterium sp.]|uniref:ActS/PrrB/RegB family redox-sensitive histidine kinase n=1 Tax=Phenylobacterium sp. TaxID=1871053 RepID=UPI00271F5A86|nr:ActS/PrrB/RegB family redox-sensitive histidine kinase [Phenylobacterium sp.]MDO8799360.1 ActS/PrrB/RegB family redox-sensitive histidine kinase [Phenylobacterium sp.]